MGLGRISNVKWGERGRGSERIVTRKKIKLF